jgi:hypothetical protein
LWITRSTLSRNGARIWVQPKSHSAKAGEGERNYDFSPNT